MLNVAGHLERLYTFKDFAQALAYVNQGAIAEAGGGSLSRLGQCKVEIWTHKINGLTESDFISRQKPTGSSSHSERQHPKPGDLAMMNGRGNR